jgi:hypothetical protein
MPHVILAPGQDGKPLLSDQSLRGQGSGFAPRLPSGLPAADGGREGFPDMSRFALLFTEQEASCHLPDKEFRYLRTVIVTAAVYRGLVSELRTEVLTPPRNLPAPGRRQPLYVVLRLSRDLCFW